MNSVRQWLGRPSQVISKTQKMIHDISLLNTQHYKVKIKGKVDQFKWRSSTVPLYLGVVAIEMGTLRSPSITVANFLYFYIIYIISIWLWLSAFCQKISTSSYVIGERLRTLQWLSLFSYFTNIFPFFSFLPLPSRIHRLHLCKGVRSPHEESPRYDTK